MKTRMMCTDCLRTAEADTLLEGSDTLELVAWCCFALPGLFYCWWRHALRIKVCRFCGSRELVREARAAAARQPSIAPPAAPAPVRSLSGRFDWPAAFAAPRDRLRHGGVVALFASTLLASLVPAALDPAGAGWAFASSAAALGLVWFGVQGLRMAQASASLMECRAWDAEGRPIHIERVF
jgi:hypothetical protein